MTTSKTDGTTDSEDLEAELIAGLGPDMHERVMRVRRFANNVRHCVRRLRVETCNWSQRELAERIGVSTSTISRLENGRGFGGVDLNIVALAFDAMDAAPFLSVVSLESELAGNVVDASNRASGGLESDIGYGRFEIPEVSAARAAGTSNAGANEVVALRADLQDLRRDVQDLRRLLMANQAQHSQRSAG